MKTIQEYLQFWNLEKVFAGVKPEEVILKTYHNGENFFLAGQEVSSLYFLAEGCARLYSHSKDGREVLVNFKEAPGIFGEMEVLLDREFQMSMAAWGEATVIQIPRKVLENRLLHEADFWKFLAEGLAEKMSRDSARQIQALLQDGKSRAAQRIRMQSLAEGKSTFLFSCQDTARDAGLSQRQLLRILTEWEENGIIKRQGRKLTICDPEELCKLTVDL